ncbi:flippase [soil metagenome]
MRNSGSSYWLTSGFYTMMQRITTMITGFGSFYILVRILDKNELGTWALFITVTALIEVARGGLIQNALIKFSAGADEQEKPKIMNASLVLNTLVTIISIIILFAVSGFMAEIWKAPELKNMFYLYTITTFILIFYYQFNFLQQSLLDFKGIFYSNLMRQGIFFLGILASAIFHFKLELYHIVWLMTGGAFLGTIVSIPFIKSTFKISFTIEWERVKTLFNYGKFVFGTNISSMIYTSIDQVMLGILLPVSSVAVFNTANRITNFAEVPLSSVAAIVFPQSAIRIETGGMEAVCYLYERSVGLLIAIILPVAIICLLFAKQLILLIAGSEYLDATPILQVIVLATILQPFIRQFGVTMDSIGKPKTNFLLLVLIAFFNILSNYIFISNFGVFGAAFGTFSALVIFVIISQFILRKEVGVKTHHTLIYAYRFYIDGYRMLQKSIKSKFINKAA